MVLPSGKRHILFSDFECDKNFVKQNDILNVDRHPLYRSTESQKPTGSWLTELSLGV